MSIEVYSRLKSVGLILLALVTLQSGCNSASAPETVVRTGAGENEDSAEPKVAASQDAEVVYSDAIARAQQEEKNLFVHLSGPG